MARGKGQGMAGWEGGHRTCRTQYVETVEWRKEGGTWHKALLGVEKDLGDGTGLGSAREMTTVGLC